MLVVTNYRWNLRYSRRKANGPGTGCKYAYDGALVLFPDNISIGEDVLGVPAKNKFDASNLVESLNNDFVGTISSSTYGWCRVFRLGNDCTVWTSLFLHFFTPAFRILLREDLDTGDTKKEK